MDPWTPVAGQLVLIEPTGGEDERCLTGIVLDSEGPVVIDLGASPRPRQPECEVMASFFDPDALYRVSATARTRTDAPSVLDLTVHDVERVQRRRARRLRANYPVALTAFDAHGDFVAVVGQTVDLGSGGCRVVTPNPYPTGADPAVAIRLGDNDSVVALGRVLDVHVDAGRYEYRVAFLRLADDDAARLAGLASPLPV